MKKEVFFTADDFGLGPEINLAIVRSHREGVLHGASLMMGQRATAEAVQLARDNQHLRVGLHLHLCDSTPVTCAAWPWGSSPHRAGWSIGLSHAARALMRREVEAQWDLFRATGLGCAFVNGHHHLHVHPAVCAALMEVLPQDFTGWVRLGQPRLFSQRLQDRARHATVAFWSGRGRRRSPRQTCQTLWGLDRLFRMQASEILSVVPGLSDGLHEFMFHPRATENDRDVACLLELRAHSVQSGKP
ncbi:MAG: ChbG/HpnK family deacetylase [Verrucomicrobia bacterium]|nr:ChbG/HpnK family deacetylase [Verrucomicrobiota bacterium]